MKVLIDLLLMIAVCYASHFDYNQLCLKEDNGFSKHPYDCHKFIRCSHQQAYEFHCPANLLWNHDYKTCDFSYRTPCQLYYQKNEDKSNRQSENIPTKRKEYTFANFKEKHIENLKPKLSKLNQKDITLAAGKYSVVRQEMETVPTLKLIPPYKLVKPTKKYIAEENQEVLQNGFTMSFEEKDIPMAAGKYSVVRQEMEIAPTLKLIPPYKLLKPTTKYIAKENQEVLENGFTMSFEKTEDVISNQLVTQRAATEFPQHNTKNVKRTKTYSTHNYSSDSRENVANERQQGTESNLVDGTAVFLMDDAILTPTLETHTNTLTNNFSIENISSTKFADGKYESTILKTTYPGFVNVDGKTNAILTGYSTKPAFDTLNSKAQNQKNSPFIKQVTLGNSVGTGSLTENGTVNIVIPTASISPSIPTRNTTLFKIKSNNNYVHLTDRKLPDYKKEKSPIKRNNTSTEKKVDNLTPVKLSNENPTELGKSLISNGTAKSTVILGANEDTAYLFKSTQYSTENNISLGLKEFTIKETGNFTRKKLKGYSTDTFVLNIHSTKKDSINVGLEPAKHKNKITSKAKNQKSVTKQATPIAAAIDIGDQHVNSKKSSNVIHYLGSQKKTALLPLNNLSQLATPSLYHTDQINSTTPAMSITSNNLLLHETMTEDPRLPFRSIECQGINNRRQLKAMKCYQYYQCFAGWAFLLNCHEGGHFLAKKCVLDINRECESV